MNDQITELAPAVELVPEQPKPEVVQTAEDRGEDAKEIQV